MTYARWVRTGQAKGIVRPEIEPHVAARLISSLGTGYQVLWEISAPPIDENDWIASLCGGVESFRRWPLSPPPDGRDQANIAISAKPIWPIAVIRPRSVR